MRVVLFTHSLLSDWNHGNAHFLRGIATELSLRGHEVRAFEPADAWSYTNLVLAHGRAPVQRALLRYPQLSAFRYDERLSQGDGALDEALDGADLVLVHEWNAPALVARIGAHRLRTGRYRLLFHDTHHRSVSDEQAMARYDLSGYDGVLAFGRVIRDIYLRAGWSRRAYVWHEAADTRVFHPVSPLPRGALAGFAGADPTPGPRFDLAWIGNWGDEERSEELRRFLVEPVRALGLLALVHGVRYPEAAVAMLADAGIRYAGYLPNFEAPGVFARARMTIHVPRRHYARALPGIPTIRVFEALACGIPLVCAPWDDAEGLFSPGADYLVARTEGEMQRHLAALMAEPALRASLSAHGLATVRSRHTCAHRVDELLAIAAELGLAAAAPPSKEPS